MRTFFIMIIALGLIFILTGLVFSLYPRLMKAYRQDKSKFIKLCIRRVHRVEKKIGPSYNSKIYTFEKEWLYKLNSKISVQRLFLLKWVCMLGVLLFTILVTYTNTNIVKQNIMGSWWKPTNNMNGITVEQFKYNSKVFKEIFIRVGEKQIKSLDRDQKLKTLKDEIARHKIAYEEEEQAMALLSAYEKYKRVRVINWNLVISMIISFFMPELFLLGKRIIIGKKYSREAIKMENIFELLAGITDFKTSFILKEMTISAESSKRILEKGLDIFYSDREKGLEYIRKSIPDRNFHKLVDILRVYSSVDKTVAIQIMERNRKEKEEQMLLTAEEDMDVVDIFAFLSIVPILFELGNLMIKPMMDLIFETFNYI